MYFKLSTLGVRVANYPVGSERLNMVSTIRFQNMLYVDIFLQMYSTKIIKDVVISETNRCFKSPVVLIEDFHVIGCNLIMVF